MSWPRHLFRFWLALAIVWVAVLATRAYLLWPSWSPSPDDDDWRELAIYVQGIIVREHIVQYLELAIFPLAILFMLGLVWSARSFRMQLK